MVERKPPHTLHGSLSTPPEPTHSLPEQAIGEKASLAWQKELKLNAGLIKKTEKLYLEGNEQVINAYRRLMKGFEDPAMDDIREKVPPFEEAVRQIIDYLKRSHTSYSKYPTRPFNKERNKYELESKDKDYLTPRQVRLFIIGNRLISESLDKKALYEYEGFKRIDVFYAAIRGTNEVMFMHMRPVLNKT